MERISAFTIKVFVRHREGADGEARADLLEALAGLTFGGNEITHADFDE